MLYFRFNVDAYETVTYEGEKSAEVTLGDIEDCVFEKLHLSLIHISEPTRP